MREADRAILEDCTPSHDGEFGEAGLDSSLSCASRHSRNANVRFRHRLELFCLQQPQICQVRIGQLLEDAQIASFRHDRV
jgi:hypothetical protein